MELAYRIDLRDALYTHGYYKEAKYFEDENKLLFYRIKVEKKLYRILKTIIDENSFNHLRETNKIILKFICTNKHVEIAKKTKRVKKGGVVVNVL